MTLKRPTSLVTGLVLNGPHKGLEFSWYDNHFKGLGVFYTDEPNREIIDSSTPIDFQWDEAAKGWLDLEAGD